MRISGFWWFVGLIIFITISEGLKDDDYAHVPPSKKKISYKKGPPPLPDLRPEGRGALKGQSPFDPVIEINDKAKSRRSMSTGTAFSISKDGIWVTAKHVTQGCDKLVLLASANKGYRVKKVFEHSRADVSLLTTAVGTYPFKLEQSQMRYDEEGFHFGYPRGEPGDVYSRLIGRRTIKSRKGREHVLVWAERLRRPDHNLPLGGISGGPILNKAGHIAGVHIAGSIRRGRAYSSLPATVESLLHRANLNLRPVGYDKETLSLLNPQSFTVAGTRLRRRLSVAKVVCMVN